MAARLMHQSTIRDQAPITEEGTRSGALLIGASLALLLLAAACGKEEKGGGAASGEAPVVVVESPSARPTLVTFRPLLDEAARAELDADGLFIDLGTADQHKYTRGGWRTGWGASAEEQGVSRVAVDGRRAWLELMVPDPPPSAIALRARSRVPGQTLSLHRGDKTLGSVELGAEWTTARLPIAPGALPAGPLRLELRTSSAAPRTPRAEVDWLWLTRAAEGAAPPAEPRVAAMNVAGKARRALAAPGPRTLSFYLEPRSGARLVVDLGAPERATFVVSATSDDGDRTELLRESVEGRWLERVVSLERFAHRPVRLDLTTADQTGPAGWGEPEIALEPAAARAGLAAAAAHAPAPAAPPKNVVFILIDTQRADAFAPFAGPGRVARTPSFDALARQSTAFVRAYDNENWTKPSVATTLSGLYPSTHDTKKDASRLPDGVELLSEHLQAQGFATAGFVANGYISDKFGFRQGWDHFRNYIRENRPSEAEHVYSDALAWLESRPPDRPFFLYLQTIDPHVNYEVDRAYSSLYFDGSYRGPLGPSISAADQVALATRKLVPTPKDLAWLRALYWGEVTYHDEHLGRFVADLADRQLLASTLVVVTNDHGEELGDRGRFGHGHQLHEEMVRAPLIMSYAPIFPPGAVVEDIVEQVDLAPTILDALGRRPLAGADGVSFLPLIRGEPVQRPRYAIIEFLDGKRAVRVGRSKLLVGAGDWSELYDLDSDPGETRDLATSAPIARRICQVMLGEGLAVPAKARRLRGGGSGRRFESGTADIDRGMRRQLDALGYFGGQSEGAADEGKKKKAN